MEAASSLSARALACAELGRVPLVCVGLWTRAKTGPDFPMKASKLAAFWRQSAVAQSFMPGVR